MIMLDIFLIVLGALLTWIGYAVFRVEGLETYGGLMMLSASGATVLTFVTAVNRQRRNRRRRSNPEHTDYRQIAAAEYYERTRKKRD